MSYSYKRDFLHPVPPTIGSCHHRSINNDHFATTNPNPCYNLYPAAPVTEMAKGEKQWMKQGFLAKQKLIEYEKERNKRIKKNNKKMNALQVKGIAASLMSSTQSNRVDEKGKNIRVEVDDNDYIPLDHHDDDESFESVEDEGRFKYLPGQVRAFGMLAGGTGITPMFQFSCFERLLWSFCFFPLVLSYWPTLFT